MLRILAVVVVASVMLVVSIEASAVSVPGKGSIDASQSIAARYPLRSRTPDFFGRSMGRPSNAGRYRA